MQEKLFGSKIVLRPIHPPLCLWFHASLFLTKDRTQLVEGVSKVGQCLLIGNYAEKEKMGWGGGIGLALFTSKGVENVTKMEKQLDKITI